MSGLLKAGEGKIGGPVYPKFGYRRRVGFSALVVVVPAAIVAGFFGGLGSSGGWQIVGVLFGVAVAPMLGLAGVVGLVAIAARRLGLNPTPVVAAVLGAAIGTIGLALLSEFSLGLIFGAIPGAVIGLVWSDPAALSEG